MLIIAQESQHLALLTFVFPDSLSPNSAQTAPPAQSIAVPESLSAKLLPSTSSPLSPISQDSTLAFSLRYADAPEFLASLQEIPDGPQQAPTHSVSADENGNETKRWIMRAAKGDGNDSRGGFRRWAHTAWTEFVDLLKVRSPFQAIAGSKKAGY